MSATSAPLSQHSPGHRPFRLETTLDFVLDSLHGARAGGENVDVLKGAQVLVQNAMQGPAFSKAGRKGVQGRNPIPPRAAAACIGQK